MEFRYLPVYADGSLALPNPGRPIRMDQDRSTLPAPAASGADREALYRIMRGRRDVRRFRSEPVPADVLVRILEMAHCAPSVGYMQPWNFILIHSTELRSRIKAQFEEHNARQMALLDDPDRQRLYAGLKLEGILEAPLNLAVTCDRRRDAPFVLGRGPMPETDLFSTCLAVQNLWLAARAEGVGVGWVSILDREATERLLELPEGVQLVAYLCVGYPIEFEERPMLERVGWKRRLPLPELVFADRWGTTSDLFDS
jgi:5,6-dimethylbenzimidazole synthase